MNGSPNLGRLRPVVLHDVNLASTRPGDAVIAHHPERGPDRLARRDLNAGFESAVLKLLAEGAVELRLDTGRIVCRARIVGLDHQVPVAVQVGSCTIADHVLDLAGAENTLAGFEGPKLVVAAGRCKRPRGRIE